MKSSANDLERYRDKRDPTRTNEPFGAERIARTRETWRGDFVVHQHGARRMHWDLRLEMGGTLTSFAVPRGPSLDPADKRLAVQTEDHPLEYLDFEDVIPEGNYGAGPMIVWDIGRVQYLEHHAEHGEQTGKLDFLLFGQKLQGRYALVLTGKNKDPELGGPRQWLLLKKPDAFVRLGYEITEKQPHSVLSGLTIDQIGVKAEVARALEDEARKSGAPEGSVNAAELAPMPCVTRPYAEVSRDELVDVARLYELELDGARVLAQKHGDTVALRYGGSRQGTISYPEIVRAVRALPAEQLVLDGEIVTLDDQGRPSFERLGPRLRARHPAEVAQIRADVAVSYVAFDVLQLGPHDLRSLPLAQRKALLRRLLPGRGLIWTLDYALGDGRALFDWCRERQLVGVVSKLASGPYRAGAGASTDWIKHKCTTEVAREESSVVRAEIASEADPESDAVTPAAARKPSRREPVSRAARAPKPRVVLSNRQKVFWPDEGYTKGDVLDYYAAISETLLPHLRDRPVMLVRYPDGITGKSFYQWNVPRGTPGWVQTLSLRDEERDGKTVDTFLVDSVDALLHVVNLGCIPLHVLACRRPEIEHCDFLTIDFDLGGQPLHQGVKLALSLRELLAELGLAGYPKTSGQSGLHVLIPLGPSVTFDTAKALVELIGRVLQLRHSEVSTMERRVSERRGRVYIDTGQTGRSRTIVAPYSVRAYPGASVSTPLYWEEVHMALDPRQLTMFTVPGRVSERGDPLERMLDERPDIPSAVARLGALLAHLR